MYELLFDPKALEQLKKLPKETRERIFNKLITTKNNPHRYFKRLTQLKTYKLRIGTYRAIADLQDNKLIILIIEVKHRKKAYKN